MRRYRENLLNQQQQQTQLRCFDPEKGLILAKPGHPRYSTSNITADSSSSTITTPTTTPTTTTVPVLYSYRPKMELTLISPLRQQLQSLLPSHTCLLTPENIQNMQQILETANHSVFNMQHIVAQLCKNSATNPLSSAVVQILQLHDQMAQYKPHSNTRLILHHQYSNKESSSTTTPSSGSNTITNTNTSIDSNHERIFTQFLQTVQRIGVLTMSTHTIDTSIALGNALQYIHQQIPKEVSITLTLPQLQISKNIYRACMCLLQEYALIIELYEQKTSINQTNENKNALKYQLTQARNVTDAAMIELFM